MKSSEAAETEACRYIATLVYDRCRIRLHDGKEALIQSRLGKRIRAHGFQSLPQYCEFLRTRADEDEFTQVIDALSTNFTHFLREPEHFKVMTETALPAVLTGRSKKFSIWSAASSSGEEPYSIAFHLAEKYPVASGWDWHITASDISTKVLAKAQAAIYPAERLESIPMEWVRKYFDKGAGQWEGQCRVKQDIARRVSFRQINLIEPYDHTQLFEVIFCRNVMIYFDRATQEQLVNRLARFLVPGGYLFIGHSESLNGMNVPLRCLRPSIYQRNAK